MNDLVDACAEDLGLDRQVVLRLAKSAPYRIRRTEIEKNGGGKRVIWQAAIETKGIHYALISNYLSHLPIHSASQAFSPGSSIKKNARLHAGNRYFLRIDLENFFPSISFESFKRIIEEHSSLFNFHTESTDTYALISGSCFDRKGRLPIGYATSPFIANAVMLPFDRGLTDALNKKFGSHTFVYTRYADDLVLSTNLKGASREAHLLVREYVARYTSPKLWVNHKKTHFGSTAKGTAYVTGIHMLTDRRTAATKKLRGDVRFLLSLLKTKKIPNKDFSRLLGLLAHLKNIDPAYYTKLSADFYSVFPPRS